MSEDEVELKQGPERSNRSYGPKPPKPQAALGIGKSVRHDGHPREANRYDTERREFKGSAIRPPGRGRSKSAANPRASPAHQSGHLRRRRRRSDW